MIDYAKIFRDATVTIEHENDHHDVGNKVISGPLLQRLLDQAMTPDQRSESWYTIRNKASGGARIDLFSDIGEGGVTAKDFVNQLNSLSGPIDLHVNSAGGSLFDGLAIVAALKAYPSKVTAFVDGMAASIASVIAVSCDKLYMAPSARLYIHDAHAEASGNAAAMGKMGELLDGASDDLAAIYAAKAGGTVASWRATMRNEKYYTAPQAVAAGLCDGIR